MMLMLIYMGLIYVGVQENWPPDILFYPFLLIMGLYFGLLCIHNKRHPERKIKWITYIPYELREEDEGMQWVTYKATRKVYIFYYFAIPPSIVIVTFVTFIPYLEIWLLVSFGVIQYFIYWYETRKVLKEDHEC